MTTPSVTSSTCAEKGDVHAVVASMNLLADVGRAGGVTRAKDRGDSEMAVTELSPGITVLADDRLRELYARHGRTLFRFLMKMTCGDVQVSEDLLQETMLRAWRSLPAALSDDEDLRLLRWLFTVARRVAIDLARRRHVRPAEIGCLDFDAMPGMDDPIERMVDADAVRRALNRLDPRQRDVLFEVFICGRQPAEVAERLGIPLGTVKSRVHYGLRALRGSLPELLAA